MYDVVHGQACSAITYSVRNRSNTYHQDKQADVFPGTATLAYLRAAYWTINEDIGRCAPLQFTDIFISRRAKIR
jgi:hypothetical protein